MATLLPALAVAFAAFCVWLTVRIVNRREQWAKWMLAGLILVTLAVYPFAWPHWVIYRWNQRPRQWNRPAEYSPFTPMEWLTRHDVLPDWYLHYYSRQIQSEGRMRLGPVAGEQKTHYPSNTRAGSQ